VIEVQSEITQLRANIELELAAMRSGLSGLAAGTSKHAFIDAKMKRIGIFEEQLSQQIGSEQATSFSCQAYIRVMDAQ
jgi:hypothetical protein